MATYAICDRVLTDTAGNVVSSAQIEVRLLPGATLATIYSGRTGGAKTNPIVLTASDQGRVKFHAPGGAYRLTNLLTGDVWDYVAIGTGAEVDSDAFVLSTQIREKLTAARTYYVRTDGSDSNTGLANTAGGAFLTLAAAVTAIQALDRSTYNVTVGIAAGTYTGGASVTAWGPGTGTITFNGVGATTIISTTSANCFYSGGATGRFTISNMKVQTTTGGNTVQVLGNGGVSIGGGITFGACAGTAHIAVQSGGYVDITAAYTISGDAAYHIYADGGTVYTGTSVSVTASGSRAFTAFIFSTALGKVFGIGGTYTGTFTGQRYSATVNGAINTYGSGVNYFPGNSAGTTASGGVYA